LDCNRHSDSNLVFLACADLTKKRPFKTECTFQNTQGKYTRLRIRIWFLFVHSVLKGRFLAKSAQIKNTRFKSECTNTSSILPSLCIVHFLIWKSMTHNSTALCFGRHTFEGQCCFERPFFGQVSASQKHKVRIRMYKGTPNSNLQSCVFPLCVLKCTFALVFVF
jgi:hypothetical protein